jgi:hypothetical protein
MTNQLPPFPVDDGTLDMLWLALHPGPEANKTSLWDFLDLMSEMGGSDIRAVEQVLDDGSDGGPQTVLMRDQHYHDHDVLSALIEEVRRLRADREDLLKMVRETALMEGMAHADCEVLREEIRELASPSVELPWEGKSGRRVLTVRPDDDPETLPGAVFVEIGDPDDGCMEIWLPADLADAAAKAMTAGARVCRNDQ